MLSEKDILTEEDLCVLEMMDDPVFFGEYVRSSEEEDDNRFTFNNYQKRMLLDNSPYVCVCTGRATGKTLALETKIMHIATINKYEYAGEDNEATLVVQNKAQLDPVFGRLSTFFKTNHLLKNFVSHKFGMNKSEHIIQLTTGGKIRCRIIGAAGDSNVVGLHTPCILVDEAQLVNYEAWMSLQQCLNSWIENAQLWVSGVPRGLRDKNVLFECDQLMIDELTGRHIFSTHHVSRLESPRYTDDQHFADLKRYGGKEGDNYVHLVCFPEGTPVVTSNGIKDITEVSVGDCVLSESGEFTKVVDTKCNDYSGDLVGIKVYGDYRTYYSTPNHKILTTKVSKCKQSGKFEWKCWYGCNKKCTNPFYESYSSSFIEAKHLDKNNRLYFPSNIDSNSINDIRISEFVSGLVEIKDFVRVKNNRTRHGKYINKSMLKGDITNVVVLDEDFMSLLGWYLAEGSVIRGNCLQFSLSSSESHVVDFIVDTLKTKFNISCTVSRVGNSLYVKSYNTVLCRFMESLCGIHSWKKKIHETILNLDSKLTSFLVDSFILGDGHVRKRNNREISCTTVSYDLATDIRFLLQKQGTFASISRKLGCDVGIICNNTKKTYSRDSFTISFVKNNNKQKYLDDKFVVRIREVCEKSFSGKVYNLTTEAGNYCLPSYIVKNCGEHGSPAFSVFDRSMMLIEEYPVYLSSINNAQLQNVNGEFHQLLSCPELPSGLNPTLTCLAIDAGFSNDPSILTLLYQVESVWREFARYELRRIKYPIQAKIINYLDNAYGFNMITMDAGSSGLAVGQFLQEEGGEYCLRDSKRLTMVDFQGTITTGYDEEGKEIRDRVKRWSIPMLAQWAQNDHLIAFSLHDSDVINELERVGFTRDMLGFPKYFVYSDTGKQGGDDHILASLLTWVYAFYNDYYSPEKPNKRGRFRDLAMGGNSSVRLNQNIYSRGS